MEETTQETSAGLNFAEQHLLRHGWQKGKGLGRAENGISEAIKVKVKCDKSGVGHKQGEQFSFHWWDHVFNKASSSLAVETGQNGVTLKATEDNDTGPLSNKKPRKAQQAKSMLYGSFVKSATLLSGQEHPEVTLRSGDSSSSSEDEDQKLDLSSTTKLSDADLLKACGGRTAHKGARHGFNMSAKLARLEQQEKEFMNKYGKKNNAVESSANGGDPEQNPEGNPDAVEKPKCKKSKRNEDRSAADMKPTTKQSHDENTVTQEELNEESQPVQKKTKRRKESKQEVTIDQDLNKDSTDSPQRGSSVKKKKTVNSVDHQESFTSTNVMPIMEETSKEPKVMDTPAAGERKKAKKNKKKRRVQEVVDLEPCVESVPKKKKQKSKEERIPETRL